MPFTIQFPKQINHTTLIQTIKLIVHIMNSNSIVKIKFHIKA